MEQDAFSHSDTKEKCTANVQKSTTINYGARQHQTMTRIENGETVGRHVSNFIYKYILIFLLGSLSVTRETNDYYMPCFSTGIIG